jgi:hypothetical protein
MKLVLAIALLAAPAVGCSKPANDAAYSRLFALGVKKDCLSARSQAPNAAFAHHLERLCDCSERNVAAAGLSPVEGEDVRGQKIQTALKACEKQLGGVADAEDYKATGMKPPANSSSP